MIQLLPLFHSHNQMERVIFSENTPNDEIIVYNKERFYPKLGKKSIARLTDIFCVETLTKTRCFSVEARPVRLTNDAKGWLGISGDDYTIADINCLMKGKNILVVRRDTSNPEKFVVFERKFDKLDTLISDYPYIYSYASIEHNSEIEENISLRRIFMPTSEVVKIKQSTPSGPN